MQQSISHDLDEMTYFSAEAERSGHRLLDSVASDSEFAHSISVPIGFPDSTLNVPRPNGTLLYIKLRDDPGTVNPMVLAVLPDEE